MNKTILFLLILIGLASVSVFAQDNEEIVEKRIKVVKNRQFTIKDEVYEGTEFDYSFKIPSAKFFSIKIISKDADFKLAVADEIEVYPFTKWIKTYNGKPYDKLNTKLWIVKVRSNYKSAAFKLTILVR